MSYLRPILSLALLSSIACAVDGDTGSNSDKEDGFAPSSVFVRGDQIKDAQVLTMNEEALAAKLRVIDAAGSGDSLDLVYYLWSDDESSSFMAQRVIAAVQRGANVRIILDYLTNIGRYNFYQGMKSAAENGSEGTLDFAFYNPPADSVRQQFRFLLTPCSLEGKLITDTECTQDRRDNAESPAAFVREKLFFTGLFGGSKLALGAATTEVAAQFDAASAAGGETSDEDKEAAAKGLRLLFDAKVKGDPLAAVGVFFLADKLRPLEEAVNAVANPDGIIGAGDEWEHLTDFVHQKLTLLTPGDGANSKMVLGGRNVENSYHVSSMPEGWAEKYIFLDVDFYSEFATSDNTKIKDRFTRLWSFDQMVVPMDDARLIVGSSIKVGEEEVMLQYDADFIATQAASYSEFYAYDGGQLTAIDRDARWPSSTYERNLAGQLPTFSNVNSAGFHYIENIPNPQANERSFGTGGQWGAEAESGKFIHATWLNALDAVCKNGDQEEVVIHNAYLILPTRMQLRISQALRDSDSCPGVSKFTVITNSRESTDLNVINVFNESYIKPLLDEASCESGQTPCIDYFEYTTNNVTATNETSRSLHAKVMIFGDDIYIGSANADGRSEFMDANNGAFLVNAPGLVAEYQSWLKGVVLPQLGAKDPHNIRTTDIQALLDDNIAFFSEKILDRWANVGSEATAVALKARLRGSARAIAEQLFHMTSELMTEDPSDNMTMKLIDREGNRTSPPANMSNEEFMALTDRQLQLL